MKKFKLIPAVVILVALTFQSCFEIKEILNINKDGSGSFSMVIDLSQVKLMMEGLGGSEDGETASPFSDMEAEYENTRSQLEEIEGISNITFTSEMEGYVVKSGFDFSNIDALNMGMAVIYEQEYEGIPEYYKFNKKTFERTTAGNFLDLIKNELGGDEMDVEGMDIASLFSEVAYVNEVVFYGMKIKKVKSGKAEISEDGSKLVNKYLIFNDEADQSLEFELKLK